MAHKIGGACIQCKDCVSICPTESIFYGVSQYVIDSDTCEDCAICAAICPVDVIYLVSATSSINKEKHE